MPTGNVNKTRKGIVTGGTWCVDRNKLVDFWPHEDGLAEILSEEARGGGSACNLAVDMRKLDPRIPVETIGLVGNDDDGKLLAEIADRHGIDRRQMHTTDAVATHVTEAYSSRRSRRRTHLYNQGASAFLTPDHFDFAPVAAGILHLGLPGVHERMDGPWKDDANGWVAVLKAAQDAHIKTNLELVSIEEERLVRIVRPCLPHLDLLIVNDSEIGALAGRRTAIDGETDVEAVAESIDIVFAHGAMGTVVVHFPHGSLAARRDGQRIATGSVTIPQSETVAANGAGDAFAAGFMCGYHEGRDLRGCTRLAHAAAATSLRSMSTSDSVESVRECLSLSDGWGWRGAPSATGFDA